MAERPADVAGAAISCTRFGRAFRSGGGTAATETTVEFSYMAQLTRRFAAQADVQFLFNPATNITSGRRETATVFGLRTELSF